ncbi:MULTISPECIES: hypothetical protein [unclassified Microcoleus]|uniref:hypothetical protein n=1 Tax=unclassified Microcoleus TaxID=2642155 RepID=UPI001DFCFDAA|nr:MULTISPECIES: hypothetical protein [unclassified Microcoleus]MCC3465553.1 hypothetical protein [Microcoleus sp. PH2017_06_SFM_O_A]TAE12806.1 MAG: hypothetical protein EAZ94_11415 [Oscillatoriales cyanobacterium]MCC3411677.1 hypothetical protein [Microcoleus sp. PH2017_02_FOX_O_A]MCC3514349.1 hypothetical protein [Microcoleus sp. PH2017_18_LLB_O_A]MCC3532966.1 hypothetical protein [Microcoleus sp. PH2017_25_DOB_D_A]
MDQLIQGVRILLNYNDITWENRLFLSSGTEQASVSTDRALTPYCSDAIVPRLPWRTLTSLEQKILFSSKLENLPSLYVSILNIPQNILGYLNDLGSVEDHRLLKYVLQKERVKKGISLIQEYIETFRIQSAELSEYRIGWNAPNQMTVTVGSDSCRVGLHIDNQRGSSLHRISINLGSEPRYFLFINLSIEQLYRLLSETDDNVVSKTSGSSRIGRAFMQLFPNYPVVKLRVNPGEAYIAPTEHITHDGCTEVTESLDVFFTLRSLFG